MSGKDSSTRNDTGGGGDPPSSCESLIINTQLTSPKASVLKQVKEGDELLVAIELYEGSSVIVALHNNVVAGGLSAPSVQRLRKCIEDGFNYSATVLAIGGGQVRVRVHCVS